MKKTVQHVLEGAALGAVLGVAAGLLLAPESGKDLRKDIKKLSGDFYKSMVPKLKKLKKVSQAQYEELVAASMKGFAKAKKLSAAEQKFLEAEAKRSWKHFKRHMK